MNRGLLIRGVPRTLPRSSFLEIKMKRINPDAPLSSSQKNKRFYEKHRDKELKRNAKYHTANKESIAKRHRLVAFKLTSEQHDAKLKEQNNRCAICKQEFVKTPRIDHKHSCCSKRPTCGKCTRGLLCNHCNVLIGMAQESIEVLTNAIKYLEAYNGRRQ